MRRWRGRPPRSTLTSWMRRRRCFAHHCEQAGEAWQAALWHKRAAEWAGVTNAAEGAAIGSTCAALRSRSRIPRKPCSSGSPRASGTSTLAWRLGTTTATADIFEEGRRLAEEVGDVRTQAALHGSFGAALGLVDGDSDAYVHHSREANATRRPDRRSGPADRATLVSGVASTFAGRLARRASSPARRPAGRCRGPRARCGVHRLQPVSGILMAHAWLLAGAAPRRVDGGVRPRGASGACVRDVEVLT